MSLDLVHAWHRAELDVAYPRAVGAKIIMGTSLWGDPYVPRFLNYGLPSILSSREALDKAGWELILYVDPPTWSMLTPFLYANRVPVQLRCVPFALMDVMNRGGIAKYWLLAAIHNLLTYEAGQRDAGFHMLVADVVYSDHYFANLLKFSDCPGIAQTGLTINFSGADPLLRDFRRPDGLLAVPARKLGQIGWRNIVGEWGSWSMDGIEDPKSGMPNTHWIWWRADDHVRIHSAHQSAVWISPQRCREAGTQLGGTIDSELPRYIGPKIYVPTAEDDMVYVALDDGRSAPTPHTTFPAFKDSFLRLIDYRADFKAIFRTPCVVPAEPMDGFPTEGELDLRFAHLMRLIEET